MRYCPEEEILSNPLEEDDPRGRSSNKYDKKVKYDENNNIGDVCEQKSTSFGTDFGFKRRIVWFNAIGFLLLHIVALYGSYLQVARAKLYTFYWTFFLVYISGVGVIVGAHRLWSHRAMKATLSTRIVLLILQTLSGQNCLWVWVRDHRQHHKYSDTDADPHNASRGFFFSHIGWLMSRKHPLVIKMGTTIDMSDLEADRLIMLQKKYYKTLYTIFAMLIPVIIPIYCWNEDALNSLFICSITRQVVLLNITWSVNSFAHLYGTKPYNKKILAVDSSAVACLTFGEGWHNYHHVFPYDYKASEFGRGSQSMTELINFLEKFGCFYDLKEASFSRVQEKKYTVNL